MMSQLGMGVLLNALGSNDETVTSIEKSIGKTIKKLRVDEDSNQLVFTFFDNTKLVMFDDGQSCCEHRYMHTDDDLTYYAGSVFQEVEIKSGPEENGEWDIKESQFLIITTNKGQFTVVNYNEHNGYYGGFWIVARLEE